MLSRRDALSSGLRSSHRKKHDVPFTIATMCIEFGANENDQQLHARNDRYNWTAITCWQVIAYFWFSFLSISIGFSRWFLNFKKNEKTNTFLKSSPEGETFRASALRVQASKCASEAYSVESMLYMTVGLMDLYQNTNIDVETAIIKVSSKCQQSQQCNELYEFSSG